MDKKLILTRLKEYKKFRFDADFARYLGMSPQALRKWYDRNTFDLDRLIKFFPEVNPTWLLTGEGKMLKSGLEAKMSAYPAAESAIESEGSGSMAREMLNVIRDQAATMRMMQERIAQLEQILSRNGFSLPDIAVSAIREGKNPPPTILP